MEPHGMGDDWRLSRYYALISWFSWNLPLQTQLKLVHMYTNMQLLVADILSLT